MNILRAEDFVARYGGASRKLSELYDDDEMLQDALCTLFPDFEYPDYSHLTLGEVWARYQRSPRPL